jgi:phosphoglycolate phosphatase
VRPADRVLCPAAHRRHRLRPLTPRRLLLFDIDGTLVSRAAEAHRDALYAALQSVYGIADPASVHIDFAGRTDIEITRLIASKSGVGPAMFERRRDELRVVATEEFARRCPADLSDRVVPGMREVLDGLAARADVLPALLSGNLEPIARLKLARAGIGGFFARGEGAFGSDDEDRAALPSIARERAGRPGAPHPRDSTWVIGDTPRDIACARADAVRCIAVATGPHRADELREADYVVAGADELREVLERELGRA